MKQKAHLITIFLMAMIITLLLPVASQANGPYDALRAPIVDDNGVRELGVVFARFKAEQLQQGDVLLFRLPSDFIWTTASIGSNEKAASVAVQTTDDWNKTVAGAAYSYIRYGTVNYVEVPAKHSGENNGLYQGDKKVLNFTQISDREVKVEVACTPTKGQDCFFYLYAKRVYVPSGYEGEIPIIFEAPSSSGFSGGLAVGGKTSENSKKGNIEIDETKSVEYQINASFIIGQKTFMLNGTERNMDVAPYLKDDRTFLPVRFVAQALGVADSDIVWNGAEQSVIIRKGDRTVKLGIGSKVMYINNNPVTMDVAPEVVEPGRTMLSLRWVAEALGAEVQWNASNKTVTIQAK